MYTFVTTLDTLQTTNHITYPNQSIQPALSTSIYSHSYYLLLSNLSQVFKARKSNFIKLQLTYSTFFLEKKTLIQAQLQLENQAKKNVVRKFLLLTLQISGL